MIRQGTELHTSSEGKSLASGRQFFIGPVLKRRPIAKWASRIFGFPWEEATYKPDQTRIRRRIRQSSKR